MTPTKTSDPGVTVNPQLYDGARNRAIPTCYIVDERLHVVMGTDIEPGQTPEPLPTAISDVVAALLSEADGDFAEAAGSQIVEGKLVRIAPLAGPLGRCLGVFVEVLRGRDALASAIERYGLSARESDVLSCLSFGERTKGMAKELGISEATVSDHVKSIMAKMNCHSRTQLLARVFGPS